MKKLKFLLVLTAGLFICTVNFAQVEEVAADAVIEVQDKVEVKVSELPEAVTKTLAAQFADFEATKAFQTGDSFSITLTQGEKSTVVVVDSQGNVLNNDTPEKPEEKE